MGLLFIVIVIIVALIVIFSVSSRMKLDKKLRRGDYGDIVEKCREDLRNRFDASYNVLRNRVRASNGSYASDYDRNQAMLWSGGGLINEYNLNTPMHCLKELHKIHLYHPQDTDIPDLISRVKATNNLTKETVKFSHKTLSFDEFVKYLHLSKLPHDEQGFAKAFIKKYYNP